MRFSAWLVCALLAVDPAWAQSTQPAPAATEQPPSDPSGSAGDGAARETGTLPVSLDKIKQQLLQPPIAPLRGVNEEIAHFRVEIQERQRLQELIASLDFGKPGPVPAGGALAGEIQRITRNPTDHPLEQPYAAFSTSELLTIAIENLAAKYLGGRALSAVSSAEQQRAERAAREEVHRNMLEFCEAQPNHGAGLQACEVAPSISDK